MKNAIKFFLFSFCFCCCIGINPLLSYADEPDTDVLEIDSVLQDDEEDSLINLSESDVDYSDHFILIENQLDNLLYRNNVSLSDSLDSYNYPLNKFEYRVLQFLELITISNIMLLCCSIINLFVSRRNRNATS